MTPNFNYKPNQNSQILHIPFKLYSLHFVPQASMIVYLKSCKEKENGIYSESDIILENHLQHSSASGAYH